MELKQYRDTRYYATEDGIILNGGTLRELAQTIDKQGYLCVSLYMPELRTVRVHRIVAEAFLGVPGQGLVVNHIDGCKVNNSIRNLEYVSSSENTKHAYDTGLKSKGSDLSWSKLNEASVHEIKHKLAAGVLAARLAEEYAVSPGVISQIHSGRAWSHVLPDLSLNYTKAERKRKLTAADIPDIRASFANGETDTKIAERYGVNRGTIFQIRCGRNWANY